LLPSDKAQKMGLCEKRAEQQKIKMEDRSRFVNECVACTRPIDFACLR
jgi:hypothetical protein